MFLAKHLTKFFTISLFLGVLAADESAQSAPATTKIFDQQGLVFEYSSNWELSGEPTGELQQLVLTEKTLDAQIMVISPRAAITSAKGEETVKREVVEPVINRLIKQYDDAGIKLERAPLSGVIAGAPAQGLQLRFSVDGQLGSTDIYWLLINQRLVQLIFVRPEKTAAQSSPCWDLIRRTLRIRKS
jgi:hypothetical protein